MQSKSVTAMKSFNDGHFPESFLSGRVSIFIFTVWMIRYQIIPHVRERERPFIFGFHHFTTIRTI
jgi:hypothetical protein